MKLTTSVFAVFFIIAAGTLPAEAGEFSGSELMVGRYVKPPSSSQMFSLGLDVQFAPLNMLLASQKDAIIEQGIQQACANATDPTMCNQVAKDNADLALTTLSQVSDDQWDLIEANLTDSAALDQTLLDAGITDPAARAAVTQYVEQVPASDRQGVVALSRTLANQDASAFIVEPNATLNFSPVAISVSLPMALYMLEDDTQFNLGNLMLDAKFGTTFGSGLAGFGVSGGLSLYLPTGTKEADALGLTNLFYAPKFFHRYLSLAPYVVVGVDTLVVSLQAHGELVTQLAVREGLEGENDDSVIYGKWGTGLVLFPSFLLSLVGEINGLVPLSNADMYNAIFASGGVQLKLLWLKASVAAQFPLKKPAEEDMGTIGGVNLGQVADFSILGRLMFTF